LCYNLYLHWHRLWLPFPKRVEASEGFYMNLWRGKQARQLSGSFIRFILTWFWLPSLVSSWFFFFTFQVIFVLLIHRKTILLPLKTFVVVPNWSDVFWSIYYGHLVRVYYSHSTDEDGAAFLCYDGAGLLQWEVTKGSLPAYGYSSKLWPKISLLKYSLNLHVILRQLQSVSNLRNLFLY